MLRAPAFVLALLCQVLVYVNSHPCDITDNVSAWLSKAVRKEVVIVGGGAAGLTAANTFIKERVSDIVVLEAQDYFGGRVKTYRQGSILTEDGAEWINGGSPNRLYKLAQDLGELTQPIADGDYDFRMKTQSGVNADYRGYDVATQLMATCEVNSILANYHDVGYGQCYEDKFPGIYSNFRAPASEKDAWLHYTEMWVNKDTGLTDWKEQSGKDADNFDDWGNDQWNQWKNGYDTVIDYLMKGIPSDKLKKNSPVCRIFYGKSLNGQSLQNRVLVVTKDGDSYLADHVVITVSIGHLKDRHSKIFTPALNSAYQQAMGVTKLGVGDKVQLGWDSPWWGSKPLDLQLIFTSSLSSDQSWMEGIMEFMTIHQQKNMLQAFVAGDNARKMESLSENTVKQHIMSLLRQVMGPNVPDPTFFRRTQWDQNIWVNGSYNSYVTTGGNTLMPNRNPLAKAVTRNGKPLLLWAGEHTHTWRYGCVDGAIDTGEREAYKVIDYMDYIYG